MGNSKLTKFKRPELYMFGLILLFLVVKSLLVTPITSNTYEFLGSYRFVFSDSYDWVANGIRLFENDAISFRNPGLVLLIKLLHNLNALFLLPLIGNLVFFALIFYVYKLCLLVAKRPIAIVLAVAVALNYSFNLAADSLLADIYAVSFITISFYYLVTKKYLPSLFWLGVSILFQNIGYFLLFIWAAYYLVFNFTELKQKVFKKDLVYFLRGGLYVCLALLPILAWHIYKVIKFGNPLFSRIPHFDLLKPNFNSVDFYLLNSISMFGFILIPLAVFALFNLKRLVKNKILFWSLVGLVFNFVFWVIVYEWDDRRFLIYFIPFLLPVVAYYLQQIRRSGLLKFTLVIVLLYPTILPLRSFLSSNEQPVAHNLYLQIDQKEVMRQLIITARQREGYENPLMNINPILYSAIINYDRNHEPNSTNYAFYTRYIDLNFDEQNNLLCLDEKVGIRTYVLRTVMMINNNVDLETVKLTGDCNARI